MPNFPTPELLTSLAQQRHLPGLTVSACTPERVLHLSTGLARLDPHVPMDGTVTFPAGSITKTMTAIVCLQLRDAGLLDLEAPVTNFLPDLPLDAGVRAQLRVHHLLSHTTGFAPHQQVVPSGDVSLQHIIDTLAPITQRRPVGESSYSDVGYLIAGRLTELLCGQPFHDLLRERLLAPIGLGHTRFLHEAPAPGTQPATGYVRTPNGHFTPYVGPTYGPYVGPTGGLRLTAPELLHYLQFVLRGHTTAAGEALLTPASSAELLTPSGPLQQGRGRTLSWDAAEVGGQVVLKQRSSMMAMQGVAFFVPEQQLGAVVFNNALHGVQAELRLMQHLLS